MQKNEILQKGVLVKDVFQVNLNYFIHLSYCTLLIFFPTLFVLGFLGLLKTSDQFAPTPYYITFYYIAQ